MLNVDIAPTLLDFAGIRVPEVMQGRSMRPLLEGNPPPDWRESILYSYYENSWAFRGMAREQMTDPGFQYWTAHRVGPHRGVRTDRYKLIEYYGEGTTGSSSISKTIPTNCGTCTKSPATVS